MPKHPLTDPLQKLYSEEKHRIVFWYDAEREFEDGLKDLVLDGVKVQRLDEIGSLEMKVRLELDDPQSRYLLYAPFAEPALQDDWLLDIRLYSRTFYADQASLLINELGLSQQSLRPFLNEHRPFFRSQDRLNRLKRWVKSDDAEGEIELKMLAVLCRAEQADVFTIVMRLFGELCSPEGDQAELVPCQKSWEEIVKYGLAGPFWRLAAETFGYAETEPNLGDLLIRILVTDFALHLPDGSLPLSLRHFVLPRQSAHSSAVFANHWRSHLNHYENYNDLSHSVSQRLNLDELLSGLDEEALREAMTFEAIERRLVRSLQVHISSGHAGYEAVADLVRQRLHGHWARIQSAAQPLNYQVIYRALLAATELLDLRRKYEAGLSYPHAAAMYAAYVDELFRFDQLYRLFHEAAEQVDLCGSDILKSLREAVEGCYSHWFIDQLAQSWGGCIEAANGDGLLKAWQIAGISAQQDFYQSVVVPALKQYPQGRIFVIISDGLRYEVASELAKELKSRNRLEVEIKTQLGVLPSITSLGMAALLPHQRLGFKSNGEVLVDGQPAASLEQRSALLAAVQGAALKAEDLQALNRNDGREAVKPWRVVYLYHNQIDTTGDTASSESNTFSASRKAIQELEALTNHIINSLNGSLVLITADHGFLYQEKPLESADRSGLESKPAGTIKAKKRYLLGRDLGSGSKVWHGDTTITAGTDDSLEFWLPKGANRFHFSGGARYVHGGAMLQEVVLPIIAIKGGRGVEAARKVGFSLLGSVRKLVNNAQKFEFIQTEAASDRILPVTVSVSLRDGAQLISNEVVLTFDSTSDVMADRKQVATLMIKSGQYDRKREFYLVVQDVKDKVELERLPVTIDLAFGSDF